MDYKYYMEKLREHLTSRIELKELIIEATSNHRIQKLMVGYVFKDIETYRQMTDIAQKDQFASKLLLHANYTLEIIKQSSLYKKPEMKEIVDHLTKTYSLFDEDINITDIEKWEVEGYINIINAYVLSNKKEDQIFEELINRRMKEVDWDNLFTPINKEF